MEGGARENLRHTTGLLRELSPGNRCRILVSKSGLDLRELKSSQAVGWSRAIGSGG